MNSGTEQTEQEEATGTEQEQVKWSDLSYKTKYFVILLLTVCTLFGLLALGFLGRAAWKVVLAGSRLFDMLFGL